MLFVGSGFAIPRISIVFEEGGQRILLILDAFNFSHDEI